MANSLYKKGFMHNKREDYFYLDGLSTDEIIEQNNRSYSETIAFISRESIFVNHVINKISIHSGKNGETYNTGNYHGLRPLIVFKE